MDTVAIYLRLSLEDGDLCSGGKEESESITNQRKLLTEYIHTSPQLCGANIVEFCDDGYSGKNFDRPGVKALIEAAQKKAIQCIVVKDLSRFGRDYIIVGNYISRVFPFLGVRFIAINDRFDSARRGDIDSLDTSFKTMIYDLYSRDLSHKVKSAKAQLVQRGVYINPVAPFGYRKDPNDKHSLLIDPDAAGTVQYIFRQAAAGTSTRSIAQALNFQKAPTPSMRKQGTSGAHANWHCDNFWTGRMVCELLRNRQYAGSLVWGKRVRNEIGVHRQLTTRMEERVIQDGHHEGIVSLELYERAQAALKTHQMEGPRTHLDYPLRGKIYCGVCGRLIVRQAQKNPYYRCLTPISLPEAECCKEKIYESELIEVVKATIQTHAALAVDAKKILEAKKARQTCQIQKLQAQFQRLQQSREQLTQQNQRLYEKLVDGALTKESYLREKAAVQCRAESVDSEIEALRRRIYVATEQTNQFVAHFSPYRELDTLTAGAVSELVERIIISPAGVLDIRLNYADELQALLQANRELTG